MTTRQDRTFKELLLTAIGISRDVMMHQFKGVVRMKVSEDEYARVVGATLQRFPNATLAGLPLKCVFKADHG